jgi:hypothetical protein
MRSTNYLIVLCLFWAGLLPGQGIEKLNNEINTHTYDEISPILSVDGHTLYFTRVGAPDFNRTLVLNGEDVSTTRPDEYDRYLKQVYNQITGRKVSRPEQSDFNQDVWVAESTDEFLTESGTLVRRSTMLYPIVYAPERRSPTSSLSLISFRKKEDYAAVFR